jgi:hypothetical protein
VVRIGSGICAGAAMVLASLLAPGCRGVLGIEPLELVDGAAADGAQADGGVDATPDTSTGPDAGSTDGGTDADAAADAGAGADTGADGGGPSDAGADGVAACFAEGGNCRPCCKTSFAGATGRLTGYMVQDGCICGDAGACSTECATSSCTGSTSPPPGTCAMCSDNAILQPPVGAACEQALSDCKGDPTCAPAAACLQNCP